MKNKFRILKGIKIVAAVAFFALLFGYGTMHLWNWLIPSLFHGPVITIGETIGLLVLSKILFGSFRGGWKGRGHCGNGNRYEWKQRMQERIANMTPEEKEKFKNKCGGRYWMETEPENKPV